MLTMWKTNKWRPTEIERVEVARRSGASVWVVSKWGDKIIESRQAIVSNSDRYHDTWEAAHAYLLKAAAQNVEYARSTLQRANDEYGNVKGMKRPAEEPA